MKSALIHLDVVALRTLLGLDPTVSVVRIDCSPEHGERLEILVEGEALPDVCTRTERDPVFEAVVVYQGPMPRSALCRWPG